MSNSSFSPLDEKYLTLLTRKDFMVFLDNLFLEPQEHNNLLFAHIAAVVGQSVGVKSVHLKMHYEVAITGAIDLNEPRVNCTFRIDLTNRGYVTANSYTGGRLTVWHPNDFNFYKASHLNVWMREQIKKYKKLPIDSIRPEERREILFTKDRKKEINELIYKHVVEGNESVKSTLNHYFLNILLEEKPLLKKRKI